MSCLCRSISGLLSVSRLTFFFFFCTTQHMGKLFSTDLKSARGEHVIALPEMTLLHTNVTYPTGVPAVFTPPIIM